MSYILLALFCLLPFSSLFLRISDTWHSHGAFFQLGILCSLAYSLYKPSDKFRVIDNKPFAYFVFWLGLVTALWWNRFLIEFKQYNFIVFMPFFNFLCFVLLYKCIVDYLKIKDLTRILKGMVISIGVLLIYCVLQRLNLDQFHRPLGTTHGHLADELIGTIGNPTHLAAYLTMCLPILYWWGRKHALFLIIATWAIIGATGSASGLLGAIIVTIFFYGRNKRKLILSAICLGIGVLALLHTFGWQKITVEYLNAEGRFDFWKYIFPIFQENSIIGSGLGKISSLAIKMGGSAWRQAHNEYYQLAIEGGIIGLGIAIWGIVVYFKTFFRLKENRLALCLASIFLAGLINALFNFPFHLYMPAALITFAYAGMFIIKEET